MTALLKRPTIQAAIIQSALLLIFLYTPISQFRHAIYTPADYLQSFHLTYVAVQPDEPVKNPILSDVTQDVNSWLLFDRDTLRTGQIPLWNPYNGNGVPQLANYQSGIFSVYTLPFYVLPFKWALLLTAYLRLFVSGFFTFIFFKLLGLKQLPALFGSLAFMFCGYSIVWLSYPQSGTLTFLPLSLCCLEWAFQRYERRSPGSLNRALRWPLIGLTAALTIGLLGGHPETLYFCGLLVAAYTVFRLLTVWNADHFRRAALRSLSGLILSIGLAGLLALAISAVQILPFAEYLKNSFTVATYGSQRSQLHESARLWPLSIYPDLFGNPADPQSIGFFTLSNQIFDKGIFKSSFLNDIGNFSTDSNQFNVNAFINYNENIGAYPGAITLCLAIFGIVCAVRSPKRKTILFFGGVVLLSVIFAYNLFDLKPLFNLIPAVSSSLYGRIFPLLMFALSACAAFGLDYLLGYTIKPSRRWLWIGGTLLVGILILIVVAAGAVSLLQIEGSAVTTQLANLTPATLWLGFSNLWAHIQGITITLGLAMAALSLFWLAKRPVWRSLTMIALIGLNFASTGFILRDFNPTVNEQLIYPVSPTMAQFLKYATEKPILVIGSGFLNPDANLAYHVKLTGSYDVLGIAWYNQLLNTLFQPQSMAFTNTQISELGMKLFGIEGVAVTDGALYTTLSQSPAYKLVVSNPNYAVFSYEGRVSPYHSVSQATVASSDDQALALIEAPGFDPVQTVILSATNTGSPAPLALNSATPAPIPVQGVSETTVDLQLALPGGYMQDGYLVLAKTFYPGWKARVNGESRPVYRANYAFSAIPLYKGDTTVEFYYDPDSFKIGGLLSIFGGLLLLGLIGFAILQSRRNPPLVRPIPIPPLIVPPPQLSAARPAPTGPELLDDDRFVT